MTNALLGEPEQHLDLDSEIVPYLRGTIDAAGTEVVESHLEDCETCRGEVDDLRNLVRPPRTARWPILAIAAALAAAVVALVMVLTRDRAVRPETTTRPPVVQRSAPAYDNPEWISLVTRTLADGRLPFPKDLGRLKPPGDTLRGETPDPATNRLQPSGIVVEGVRPHFTWPAQRGGSYSVSVFHDDEEVARSTRLETADWIPDRDLPRGRVYTWQVEARGNGTSQILPAPPEAPAIFRVLDEAAHAELEQARRLYPNDALLLAVLFARHGLVAEARAQASRDPRVQRLVQESPRSTNPAQ